MNRFNFDELEKNIKAKKTIINPIRNNIPNKKKLISINELSV